MAYPDGIDAMPTFIDGSGPTDPTPAARLTAAEMTTITSAITRTQTELGVNPSGAASTVAARLDSLATSLLGKAEAADVVTDAELAAALAGTAALVHSHVAADVSDLAAVIAAALTAPLTIDGGTP